MVVIGERVSAEFFRFHTCVYGAFIKLHDESIRSRRDFGFTTEDNPLAIESHTMPELRSSIIFLPGNDKGRDTDPISKKFSDEEQAIKYLKHLEEILIALNNE